MNLIKIKNNKFIKRVVVASLAALITIPSLTVNTAYALDSVEIYENTLKRYEEQLKKYESYGNTVMVEKTKERIAQTKQQIEDVKQNKVRQDQREAKRQAEQAEKDRIANMKYPMDLSWTNWNDFVPHESVDDGKEHVYQDENGRIFTITYNYKPERKETVIAERITGDNSGEPIYDTMISTTPGEKTMIVTFDQNIQSEYVGDRVDYSLMMDGNHSGDFHQFFKLTFYSPFEGPAGLNGYSEHRSIITSPVMYRPPREDIELPESLLFLGSVVHIHKGINTFYLAHTYNRLFYYSDDKEHKNGIVPTGSNAFPQKPKITSIDEIRLSFNNNTDNHIFKESSQNFTKESYNNTDYYIEKCRELLGK